MRHSDWSNPEPNPFIPFSDDLSTAQQEAPRRIRQQYVPGGESRRPASVRIAHVRLLKEKSVWFFSRSEMLRIDGEL